MIRSFSGQRGRYSYIVEAQSLRPMSNGDEWAAKLVKLFRYAESGPGQDVAVPVLREYYGRTADEAADEAIAAVEQWIGEQGD